jgi:glyoxylase-like metal-dependent hydrolase (beta-lactamase superfamily II)
MDLRIMPEPIIFEQLNPHACKTYLLADAKTKDAAIIDPVLEHVNEYADLVKKRDLKLKYIIDTHTHADHISGAAALRDLTDAEYVMHDLAPAPCINVRTNKDTTLQIGSIVMKIIETPGHTRDGISLIIPQISAILTGDALFLDEGGAGRDDLPGGDPAAHYDSLQKLLKLDENLIVYPAHEYRNRTPSPLKRQKQTNPHLKPRSKEEFVNYLNDLRLGPADWMKDVLKANYHCARDPNAAWIPQDSPACEVKGTLTQNVNERAVSFISPQELKAKLEAGEKPFLLDVREPMELRAQLKALPGVTNISITKLVADLSPLKDKKNDEIIIICRSGARATTMGQILGQAGFKRVKILQGGMIAWRSTYGF